VSAHATAADVLAGTARWCVIEGDCLAVLADLPDGCIDAVVTDPPYDKRTHKGARTEKNGSVFAPGITFAPLSEFGFAAELVRVARRWAIAFCALEQFGAYQAAAGAAWVRAGIWHKPSCLPQQSGDRPGSGHEGIAIMHRPGRKTWNGRGRPAHWSYVPQIPGREHPTQKPLLLMRELVRLFTDPGDVILDPFGGSGTTGVAALLEGRRVILVEREPAFAAIARARCAAADGSVWTAPVVARPREAKPQDERQPSLFAGGA